MQENGQALSEEQKSQLEMFQPSNEERYSQLEEMVRKEQEAQNNRIEIIHDSNEKIKIEDNIAFADKKSNLDANKAAIEQYESDIAFLRKVAAEDQTGTQQKYMNLWLDEQSDYTAESISQVRQAVQDYNDTSAKGGRENLMSYIDAYGEALDSNMPGLKQSMYDSGDESIDSWSEGEAGNTAAVDEANRQMDTIARDMENRVGADSNFYYCGMGIINRLVSGMRNAQDKLYSVVDGIVSTIKSKFTFEVSATATGKGAKVQDYATGGVVYGRQVVQVAENGPEAIVPLNRMGDIVECVLRSASGSGAANAVRTVEFKPSITFNAQKLIDTELNRAVRFVSREFAKVTGGQM